MNVKNLQFNGLGIFQYFTKPEGRTALLDVMHSDGKYNGRRGIVVHLQIVTRDPDQRSYSQMMDDPSLRLLALPLKRYSKKRFIEFLEKLDPYVPELAAAYEADQHYAAAMFHERIQELFGVEVSQ